MRTAQYLSATRRGPSPKLLGPLFQGVSVARSDSDIENSGVAIVRVVVNSAEGRFVAFFSDGQFQMSLDVAVETADGQLWKRSYSVNESFAWRASLDCSGWSDALDAALQRGFIGALERFVTEF